MHRHFTSDQLVLATHNLGKVREIGDLLRPFAVSVVSVGELGLPEPEETGTTFIANAELKALAANGHPLQKQAVATAATNGGSAVEQLAFAASTANSTIRTAIAASKSANRRSPRSRRALR